MSFSFSFLQRLSAGFWSGWRRASRRLGRWLQDQEALRGWFYAPVPELSAEARYRDFNGWYFGLLDQQERMLADGPRMGFYRSLIAQEVRPGDVVIDLGTGTGVLAAWASQAGAAQVYALDHSAILETAKTVAAANGIERVEFVAVHSADFVRAERVDVILHEQMGDFLFDEGMVANVCDLRERLLKPGGRILPSRFGWYCEPVQVRADRRVPFIWELAVPGYDYACLQAQRPDEPEYYRQASCDETLVETFLGDPMPALTVDLETLDPVTGLPGELVIERVVTRAGRLDGLVIYFEVEGGAGLRLSSSPVDRGRAPHWGFRILRTDADELAVGDVITIRLTVGRWADPDTWQWTHTTRRARWVAAEAAEAAQLGASGGNLKKVATVGPAEGGMGAARG